MKSLGKTIAIFLVLLALVLVNVIGHLLPTQADFTADRLYTLSPGSHSLLAKIEEPIELTFYYTRDLAEVPPMFKAYVGRIETYLRQYERASGGKVRLKVVNLKPDTPEEEAATRVGIVGQTLRSGEILYLGLVATQADQQQVIPVFDPNRERLLEFDLSRMLHELQMVDKPRLGVLTQMALFADFSNPMAMDPRNPPRDSVLISELRRTFEVERVEGDDLPANLDVLAIIHPGPVSEALAYQIDQFLLSGKPVFAAVDPSNAVQRASTPPQMMMMGGGGPTSSNLPRLLPRWGIEYDSTKLVGDLELAATVSTGRGPQIRYPIWLNFREFAADQPAVATLTNVILVESGSFTIASDRPQLSLTPLLQSSSESALLATSAALGDPEALGRSVKPDSLQRTLGGLIRGEFPSAFPDGPPAPAEGEEPANPATKHLAASRSSSTLVLIADADFLTDTYSVQRYQIFGGQEAIQPLNDNLALTTNLIEMLAGSDDLLSLRGGGTATRTFRRVEELQQAAQAAADAQLEQLEARLEEVNQQLATLQQQGGDARTLIASPEAQAAIEKFRQQQIDLRSERRQIRKALREDVEALGLRLGVINLVPVPVAVALLGIIVLLQRGRRRR